MTNIEKRDSIIFGETYDKDKYHHFDFRNIDIRTFTITVDTLKELDALGLCEPLVESDALCPDDGIEYAFDPSAKELLEFIRENPCFDDVFLTGYVLAEESMPAKETPSKPYISGWQPNVGGIVIKTIEVDGQTGRAEKKLFREFFAEADYLYLEKNRLMASYDD